MSVSLDAGGLHPARSLRAPRRSVIPCIPQVWTKVQIRAASGPARAGAGGHETDGKSAHFVGFDMDYLPGQTYIGPKPWLPCPVGHQTCGLLIAVIGQRRDLFHETQAAHHGIAVDCDRPGVEHLFGLALGQDRLLIALRPDAAHHGATLIFLQINRERDPSAGIIRAAEQKRVAPKAGHGLRPCRDTTRGQKRARDKSCSWSDHNGLPKSLNIASNLGIPGKNSKNRGQAAPEKRAVSLSISG